jgi:hypothetical protein
MVYFIVIWYILVLFGIFHCYLVYFMVVWYVVSRSIWQTRPGGLSAHSLQRLYFFLLAARLRKAETQKPKKTADRGRRRGPSEAATHSREFKTVRWEKAGQGDKRSML